jgi:putative acetyltransferase
MITRTAEPADRGRIQAVVRGAFATDGRDGAEEARIVSVTWELRATAPGLELVAEVDGDIAGYVLGAFGDLDGRQAVGVAPVCVAPDLQRRGIGTALMSELVARADRTWPLLLLLGNPVYYGRFGFERAAPLGIVYPPAGPDSEHFLARRLRRYDVTYRGTFRYCWELPRTPT